MAQITIAGSSYIIVSEIPMADLETVKQFRPSALAITDTETRETLFKVGIGTGSVSNHGICFGGITNDDQKKATVTMPIPSGIEGVEEVKSYVLDHAGRAMANLNRVETAVKAALTEIQAERNAVAENIKVSV